MLLIQPSYITGCTGQVKGDEAEGVFTFLAKGLFEGKVEYKAERQKDGWVIIAFHLPNYHIHITRQKENLWTRSDK